MPLGPYWRDSTTMRLLFLVPDLDKSKLHEWRLWLARQHTPLRRLTTLFGEAPSMRSDKVWGGTLNLMRHCALARLIGADAVLTSQLGFDTYGEKWGIA